MNKEQLEGLIKKAKTGVASAQREYGSMLSTGRYFSKDLLIPQDKYQGRLFLRDAAFAGDEEAKVLLVKYHPQAKETFEVLADAIFKYDASTKALLIQNRLQTEETFELLKEFQANNKKYKQFMDSVNIGHYEQLRQYGELLYYGGECFKPIKIKKNKARAKEFLLRSAFGGQEKAHQFLLDHNMLKPNEFEQKKLEYEIDKRIKKAQPLSWGKFLFGVSTGLTTYFISKVIVGEGLVSNGAIGLATFAVIFAVLIAKT